MYNKEEYKQLQIWAKQNNVHTVKSNYSQENLYKGFTVAYMDPTYKNHNMINVAVSYCSVHDEFNPRFGRYEALRKLKYGEFVQLPIASMLPNSISIYLINIFHV